MKHKVCPCGARMVKRHKTETQPAETDRQFEVRQYCDVTCAGKYRPKKPAVRGFNMEVPKNKTRKSVGPGFREFIDGIIKPVPR